MAVLQRPGCKFWYADYRDREGRRRRVSTGTADKRLAIQIEAKLRGDVAANKFGVSRRTPTLRQLLDDYISWAQMTQRSPVRARQACGHLGRILDLGKPAPKFTSDDVEVFQRERLREGAAPATIRRELTTLIASLNRAVRNNRLPFNPLAGRVRHLHSESRTRLLTDSERQRLLSAAREGPDHLYPILVVLLTTGMRKGECLGARWADLDLDKCIMTIPKTKSGKPRTIPLSHQAFEILSSLPRRGEYVFTDVEGRRIGSVKRSFATACERAQIDNLCIHDLRRSFGSTLAMAGVSPFVIKELLGHASIKTTQIYVALSDSALRNAVELIDTTGEPEDDQYVGVTQKCGHK